MTEPVSNYFRLDLCKNDIYDLTVAEDMTVQVIHYAGISLKFVAKMNFNVKMHINLYRTN